MVAKRLFTGVLCGFVLTSYQQVVASTYVQLGGGAADYELVLAEGGSPLNDTVPYGKITISQTFAEKFALSGYYQLWGNGATSLTETGTREDIGTVNASRIFDFNRAEYSVSLSYGLPFVYAVDSEGMSVLVGYRWTDTHAESVTTGLTEGFDFSQQYEMNINTVGPYVGLTYYSPMLTGVLNIGLAIGLMDVTAESQARGQENGANFDSEGLSEDTFLGSQVSISWSKTIFNRWSTGLKVEYFNYEYDVLSEKSLTASISVGTTF